MDKLREADVVVDCLGKAMLDSESGLKAVPGLLLRLINEDLWRERVIARTGEVVRFDRFVAFITTKPLEGLGTDLRTLRNLCRDNPAALDAIDRVTKRQDGRPEKTVDNINSFVRPNGTNVGYALRKLRKDAPELHAQVLAGEASPHAAMVAAGFRKRTIQIPADVEGAALALTRKFTVADLHRLVELLAERL